MSDLTELTDALAPQLAPYLTRQRWYAGPDQLEAVRVLDVGELCTTGDGTRHLYDVVVEAGGARYQLLVGRRPAGEPADFLAGHGDASFGAFGDSYLYDATFDSELTRELLAVVTGGVQVAERVRPISAEQSNTSLVFDDRVIMKIYRRLVDDGDNPDIEVTTALAQAGFAHVARPFGVWRRGGTDLAFAQEFLAGGAEGWALALTSLRDFYESPADDPGDVGGDFSMEARRLGRVTAELHLTMAQVFPARPLDGRDWSALASSIGDRLARVAAIAERRSAVADRLASVAGPGPSIRVHGDYHLGQVMRADGGWYILDFEGEPARPRHERVAPASPMKDVAGMLRSFDYAAMVALAERRGEADPADDAAARWSRHNRTAFLSGYLDQPGIDSLLPPAAEREVVLAAYELDKALYELDYERAYRPTWESIPLGALDRIVGALTG